MKFGEGIFDLSSEYRFERSMFRDGADDKKIYLGLPQWAMPEWKGAFYNKETKSEDFLNEYSRLLNCVEVSSTFYAEISKSKIEFWCESTDVDFKFLPKWPKHMTHDRLLNVPSLEIGNFIKSMEAFESKLGATILQLPPGLDIDYKRELFEFLKQIPTGFPICLEFRNRTWFEDNRIYQKLEDYLLKMNIGMVCSDTPSFPEYCHYSYTGVWNIIRYASDGIDETDKVRLGNWGQWLNSNKVKGEVFFTLHRPVNDTTPELIGYFDKDYENKIKENLEEAQKNLFDMI